MKKINYEDLKQTVTAFCTCWKLNASNVKYGNRKARESYIHHYGEIPHELDVLHHCDEPMCVNPTHLFLGTHADNMRDKMNKKRDRVTKNWTDEQIEEAFKLRDSGMSVNAIGRHFGRDKATVTRLLKKHGRYEPLINI